MVQSVCPAVVHLELRCARLNTLERQLHFQWHSTPPGRPAPRTVKEFHQAGGPVEGNFTVLTFSHLRWDFVYQRPQHLLSRLARRHRVLFIEEPVFDAAAAPHMERLTPEPGVTV